jgi:hypothetical protein
MGCPDWSVLAARRQRNVAGEYAEWTAAVEHFDACTLCRRDAVAADPLLVFRRLPGVEMTPAEESSEVAAMRQAVAAMRTGKRLEARRSFAGWRRWAAAAVLAVVSLSVSREREPQLDPVVTAPQVLMPGATPAAVQGTSVTVLEGVDDPAVRVYQVDSAEVSSVMIIDPSLPESNV